MVELEIQILSDRREGLLVELGRLVVASGFTLQRQRVYQDSQGAWLVMNVRGSAEQQLALEEKLATHNRVLSFEASLMEEGSATHTTAPTSPHAAAATPPPALSSPPSNVAPDVRRVESMLPQLARDYPKIFPWLLAMQHEVTAEAREASLLLAGRRTGSGSSSATTRLAASLVWPTRSNESPCRPCGHWSRSIIAIDNWLSRTVLCVRQVDVRAASFSVAIWKACWVHPWRRRRYSCAIFIAAAAAWAIACSKSRINHAVKKYVVCVSHGWPPRSRHDTCLDAWRRESTDGYFPGMLSKVRTVIAG